MCRWESFNVHLVMHDWATDKKLRSCDQQSRSHNKKEGEKISREVEVTSKSRTKSKTFLFIKCSMQQLLPYCQGVCWQNILWARPTSNYWMCCHNGSTFGANTNQANSKVALIQSILQIVSKNSVWYLLRVISRVQDKKKTTCYSDHFTQSYQINKWRSLFEKGWGSL